MRGDLNPLSNSTQTKITSHEQDDETEAFESLRPTLYIAPVPAHLL